MQVSYQYKLRPNDTQSKKMDEWLDMLRSLYNWFLADRIDGYYASFIMGDYCDIRTKAEISPLTCSLSKNSMLHNPKEESRQGWQHQEALCKLNAGCLPARDEES